MRRPVLPRRLRRQRLLIVGCGDVGRRIAGLLGSRWRVFGTARSQKTADELRRLGVQPVTADLDHRRALARAARIAHWTLYLAPPPNTGAADPRLRNWLTAYGATQAGRAGASTPPPRLVYMSTTGVYGDRAGSWVSETTPVQPTTPRAKRRVDAEQQIRSAIKRGRPSQRLGRLGRLGRQPSLQAAILRVPGIYAAERLPEERLRNGLPVADGADDGYTNHVHADDLARLTFLSLMRMRSGRVFNTVDQSNLTTGQWLDLVANTLGLPPPPRVPKAELPQYLTPMMLSFLSESRRIDGRRALRELRARLRWPTVDDFLKALAASRI